MAKIELLGRRQLLTRGTKGAIAVAILGPAVVACSSNGDDAAVLVTSTEPVDTSSATSATIGTTQPGATQPPVTQAEADDQDSAPTAALRWERVNFDFVSAYVLVREGRVAIVDTGTSGNDERIEMALTSLGVGWGDVDHIVLTHLHGDHVGGLSAVLNSIDTAVPYAGEADIAGISSSRPITAVNDGDEIFGLEVIATPGHTPGSISMLDDEEGLLIAGDALNTSNGQVLAANPDFSQDLAAADNSVKVLAQRNFDTLAVGHGDPIVGDASTLVQALASSL